MRQKVFKNKFEFEGILGFKNINYENLLINKFSI